MTRSLAGIAAAFLLWPQAAPQVAPPKGAISGVVVDAIGGQPLAGATVSLARIWLPGTARPQVPTPRVVTDARGRFVFAGLDAADDYFLGAESTGYEYTRYGWPAPRQTLAADAIHRITIAAGQWVPDIKIPLWRLPIIGGRVVDERGEPVIGVAVRAFSHATIGGHPQLVGSNVATTDDRGIYRITALPPGRYVVSVLSVQSTVLSMTPEGPMSRVVGELETGGVMAGRRGAIYGPALNFDTRHRLALTNFATPPPPSDTQSRAYPAMFYPGVGNIAEATTIELGYQQANLAVDFQLRPVPAVRVSGRLEGVPAPGLLLRLMPAGGEGLSFGSEAATTLVEANGAFTFLNVPAGRYTLLASASTVDFMTGDPFARLPDAPGYSGGSVAVGSRNGTPGLSYLLRHGADVPSWGRMPVLVGVTDVDDLVLPMHPVGAVSGRIVFADDVKAPPTTPYWVRLDPANGDPSLGSAVGRATLVNGVYTFTVLGLLGGTYLIEPDSTPVSTLSPGSPTYSVVSITADGRDVTLTGIDASVSPITSDVVITLTDKKLEIRGVVSGAPGRTTGVIAFPVDRALWTNYGWNARHFRMTLAGSTGAFMLQPRIAGDFYLIAVDAAKLDAWTDPKFLAAAAPLATRVSLTWGETKAQDLTWRDVIVK